MNTAEREQTARMRAVVEAARSWAAQLAAQSPNSAEGQLFLAVFDFNAALDAGAATGGEDE